MNGDLGDRHLGLGVSHGARHTLPPSSDLKKKGVLLIYEPQHKEWKKFDALLVLFLRNILKKLQ